MTTITTTLLPPICRLLSAAGAEVATGVVTRIPLTTTVTRTTMTTTITTTITTTAAATRTPITGTTTSRPLDEGGAATGVLEVEALQPGDAAAPGHPEAGPTSPSVAGQDRAVAAGGA